MRLAPTLFSPFPAWRCSRGYCGRSRHSPEGSWHHSYCNNHRRNQKCDYMDSQSCYFLWLLREFSCDYMDSRSTILTSPSSCPRSTGPSLRQWRGEGRLLLCRSGGRDIYRKSRGESHTAAELVCYVTVLPGSMITVSHAVKNNLGFLEWCKLPAIIFRIISTVCSGGSVTTIGGHSSRQQFRETVQRELKNIIVL